MLHFRYRSRHPSFTSNPPTPLNSTLPPSCVCLSVSRNSVLHVDYTLVHCCTPFTPKPHKSTNPPTIDFVFAAHHSPSHTILKLKFSCQHCTSTISKSLTSYLVHLCDLFYPKASQDLSYVTCSIDLDSLPIIIATVMCCSQHKFNFVFHSSCHNEV